MKKSTKQTLADAATTIAAVFLGVILSIALCVTCTSCHSWGCGLVLDYPNKTFSIKCDSTEIHYKKPKVQPTPCACDTAVRVVPITNAVYNQLIQ